MSKIRLAGVIRESIVDGPGIRMVLFAQGCLHNCKGCHNPETHDLSSGYVSDTKKILDEIKKNPLLKGITLSGGEPFLQARQLSDLAKDAHDLGLDVITYTGYIFEKLISCATDENGWMNLLRQTDILIDGPFILKERSLNLTFRGSRNQRVIDVKKSLSLSKVQEIEF